MSMLTPMLTLMLVVIWKDYTGIVSYKLGLSIAVSVALFKSPPPLYTSANQSLSLILPYLPDSQWIYERR